MPSAAAPQQPGGSGTLVVYLYTHERARQRDKAVFDNFAFFLRFGVIEAPGVTYSLLVSGSEFSLAVPASPRVIVHNVGDIPGRGQMSHYKAFFDQPERYKGCATSSVCSTPDVIIQWQDYERFLLLSDVVRGPFVPSYVRMASWPSLFLSPLDDTAIKLVGATVSCEGCATSPRSCKGMMHVEVGSTLPASPHPVKAQPPACCERPALLTGQHSSLT